MREEASFPRDVVDDLRAVVGELRARAGASTEDLVGRCGTRGRRRVLLALSLLKRAGVARYDPEWHGQGQGSTRRWEFVGAGRIDLWEPAHGVRRRRLYVTRSAAVEASRRTQGPGAEAHPLAVEVSPAGLLALSGGTAPRALAERSRSEGTSPLWRSLKRAGRLRRRRR
jgi:hypothetical protein